MPNYYAHLTFGQRVLADLPAGLSELIEQEREAFDLGCLGPDPLFFYQPIRPNAVRREGIKMHRRSALPAVERLRQAIEDGVPMSTGYGAGFLCHLALDSACHGYVDDRAADGPISHMAIEGEYDRMLMERDGLNRFLREEDKRKIYESTQAGREVLQLELKRIERLYKNAKEALS